MIQGIRSLRVGGVILVISAFLLGLVASGMWFQSNARWSAYLDKAQFAGAILYDSLQSGGEPPLGVRSPCWTAQIRSFPTGAGLKVWPKPQNPRL